MSSTTASEELDPLNDKTCSDIIVKFGSNQVFAHKAYLVRHSIYFRRAFQSNFSVANSKVIDLGDDDDVELVMAMLKYLYGDGENVYSELSGTKTSPSSLLDFHIDMFIMGDNYDIPALRRRAVRDCDWDLRLCLNTSGVSTKTSPPCNIHITKSIRRVCGPHAFTYADKSLQDSVLEFCSSKFDVLLNNEDFAMSLEAGLLLDAQFTLPLLVSFGRRVADSMTSISVYPPSLGSDDDMGFGLLYNDG